MAALDAIKTLIELTSKQSEESAKRLGQANRELEQANQKLDLLEEYKKSYIDQLRFKMQQGLTISSYNNYQQFLLTLDQAVGQQLQVLQQTKQRVERERAEWQLHERKRLSYETLVKRSTRIAQHKESKRDQKQTDEQAARSYLAKK